MMNYQADILYYSNPDHANGARVTRDMMQLLCRSLGDVFAEKNTREFIQYTRIPNERELYGLMVKALVGGDLGKGVGHVATEVQVARKAWEDSRKGRVDLIFDYRGTSFLVELKVIRASVNGRSLEGEGSSPTQRLVRPWRKAVRQLWELDASSLGQALKRKIVKLPMAIYLHIDTRQRRDIPEWQACSSETHYNIVTQLEENSRGDDSSYHYFSYFQSLESQITTSSRRDSLVEGTPNVKFYGFSVIAGMPEGSSE